MNIIKVAIADDQELIRRSLELIINSKPDMNIISMSENGEELLESIKIAQPDVILMDIRMPKINGVECTRIIKSRYPAIKIIILTTFEDDEYIFNAIKYGANGYLLKGVTTSELIDSIRTVYEGGALINPNVAVKLFNYFSQLARGEMKIMTGATDVPQFSNNEYKIIQLIGMGLSNKEISDKMNLSEGTCRNYISEIISKTGLRDRTQIAIFAIQSGFTYRLIGDDNKNEKY